jgi:hypothetical protein
LLSLLIHLQIFFRVLFPPSTLLQSFGYLAYVESASSLTI